MSKPPVPSRVDRFNVLVERVQDQVEEDFNLLDAAKQAARLESVEQGMMLQQLSDEELGVLGWDRMVLNIAVDAKKSKHGRPSYLDFAHDRTITRMRNAQPTATGNAGAQGVYVLPAPNKKQLEAIDVDVLPPMEDE